MVSSARQAIACILLVFSAFIYARPQSTAEKGLTSTLTGKVTVKDKGVPGVAVSLTLLQPSNAHGTRHRGVTDDEGNYRISNVPPGNYAVRISAPAFATADHAQIQKTIIVNKGETVENIDFTLMRGGVITGKVTDSDGRPLIEEEVYVFRADVQSRQIYYGRANGRTDDRGIYRIFGLLPGSYRVAAGQGEHDGFGGMRGIAGYTRRFHPDAAEESNATVIELKEGGEATNVDITVERAIPKYSASGRIIDGETGQPLVDVSYGVQMFVGRNSSSMTSGAASNSEGEFKLHNLAPGKYAVFFETPPNSEWRADPIHFKVTDQDVTGLTVKTARGASASGVLVLEGTDDKALYAKLIKGRLFANVMTNDRIDRGSTPAASINPDGSFRVGGLRAGILNFVFFYGSPLKIVRIERDGVAYTQGVEIKDQEQITGLRLIVNYANGTIRGVVKLEKGTPPNGHFNITLRRLGENDGGPIISDFNDSPHIDARGQFVAEGLLPGTYEVSASYGTDMNTPSRWTKQQVVVNNGAVTNITLTIDADAPVVARP